MTTKKSKQRKQIARRCVYPGCVNTSRTRGQCHQHYQTTHSRLKKGKVTEEDLVERGLLLAGGAGGGSPVAGHEATLTGSTLVGQTSVEVTTVPAETWALNQDNHERKSKLIASLKSERAVLLRAVENLVGKDGIAAALEGVERQLEEESMEKIRSAMEGAA
jgi:hypothetical protein